MKERNLIIMCVICASLKNERQPSEKEIRMMFDHNPDGAGYMCIRNGHVKISKGYMNVETLLSALKKEKFSTEDPVVYHFRISTQAGVKPAMTQPFIVSNKLKSTKSLVNCGEIGLAHNGVISLTSNGDKDFSDTAFFTSLYAPLLLHSCADNHSTYVTRALEKLVGTGNKLAILSADGYINMIGSWQTYNGLNFSNLYWIPRPKTTCTPVKSYAYSTAFPSWKHQLMESYQKKHTSTCEKQTVHDVLAGTEYEYLVD